MPNRTRRYISFGRCEKRLFYLSPETEAEFLAGFALLTAATWVMRGRRLRQENSEAKKKIKASILR